MDTCSRVWSRHYERAYTNTCRAWNRYKAHPACKAGCLEALEDYRRCLNAERAAFHYYIEATR